MSKYIPGNQKHLTLEDRIYIEDELNRGTTFKDIAKFLCKDPTTISKEVKAHRISDWYHKGTFYNAKNFCVHRYHCRKTNACGKIILCGVKCSSCPTCNQTCRDFEKERCSRLDKAPYVCNGCPKKISQSPYQIVTNHPELELSVRTLYSYLDQGLFTARNVDLKRKLNHINATKHRFQTVQFSLIVLIRIFRRCIWSRLLKWILFILPEIQRRHYLPSFSQRKSCFLPF